MLRRAGRLLQGFSSAASKTAWLEDKAAWLRFHVQRLRQHRINVAFDRRHGTDTATETFLADAGVAVEAVAGGNGVYRPLWESRFAALMRMLEERTGGLGDFSFVDLGSGKGKLLLLASRQPFRRIIGVEFAPVLHAVAVRNIERFRDDAQVCRALEARLGDATAFELPAGPVIALIFNAFDVPMTERVVANIIRQRPDGGDPVVVVYENLRRAAEIGAALAVPAPWQRIDEARRRIVIGNAAAAALWRRRAGHCDGA